MREFLYAGVSTIEQNLDTQEVALKKVYPNGAYVSEKKSGTKMANRDGLDLILRVIEPGQKLVVCKLDRLCRSISDLSKITAILNEKKAILEILDQKIDTSTATGRAFLQMLGVFAEFETNLRAERQAAGIAASKKRFGRPPAFTEKQKLEVLAKIESGKSHSELAREYGVSRASIYRAVQTAVPDGKPVEFQIELPVAVNA